MKNLLIALAVAALVTPALADKTYSTDITALQAPSTYIQRAATFGAGFEAAEGYAPGNILGQQGWTVFSGDTNQVISTANPLSGAQHYRNQKEPGFSSGTLIGAFSPDQGPSTIEPQSMSVDINISAIGGADYDVVPQAPSQSFLTARVKFNWLGNIYVLDDLGLGLGYVDTGVPWVAGVYKNLTVDMDPGADSIDYWYDGSLIYSSVAGVFAGTAIEQVVLLSDNFQNAGEAGDFDNLTITPEPASILLMGVALTLIRRR